MRNLKLKARRKELGLTQLEVATASGIHEVNYQSIEAGRHLPSLMAAASIARTLDCSIEDIFNLEGGTNGNE